MTVLNPPGEANSVVLADWFELVLLIGDRRVVSPAKGHEMLGGIGAAVDEVDVAFAFGTLHDRCNRKHALYPFKFSRLGLEVDPEVPQDPYRLLLLLSAIANGSVSGDDGGGSVHLERLVTAAATQFWGEHTEAVRFGHPPEPERPKEFNDAVKWLAKKLHARALPLAGSAFRRADGGVDVVAWKVFCDGGPGPTAVIQVTYETDLRAKSLEAAGNDLDRWMAVAPPVAVLASPFDSYQDPDLFVELNQRVVVLDRWRLLQYLNGAATNAAKAMEWVEQSLAPLTL